MINNSLPEITWCKKCVLPSNAAITLSFNKEGVCSACQVEDQKKKIDWDKRLKFLLEEIEDYRKPTGYECIIGVSGGKDSYYQVHFVKEKLGLNPLLVTYNGNNYLDVGWENLWNMKNVFNTDHFVFTPGTDTLIRMNRLCFRKMGDMNWHNHAGIMTMPMKVAVKFNIPLVFWGEHGWTDMGGMHSMNDFVEYTARYRTDQALRGYDWYDMLGDKEDPVFENELEWTKYPSDEEVSKVGLRGIYIGNYDPWDMNAHTELVKNKYGWQEAKHSFDRTYRKMSNLDDKYENGIHDYLKYIKFGYGRGTDHAAKDVRRGYMSRQEAIQMVKKYDHVKSSDLKDWLKYVGKNEEWFDKIADSFRDTRVWAKDVNNNWKKRNIWD